MLSLFLSVGLGASAVFAQNSTVGRTCKITGGTDDDSPAIKRAFADCATGGTIEFSAGVDYTVGQPILANNLTDVNILVDGNLHLPQDVEAVRKIILGSSTTTFWFDFKGSNINWIGSKDPNSGWINSYGQQWWDLNPWNGTGITGRPHLMKFNIQGGTMQRMKSRKPVAWNIQIHGRDIEISDAIVDAVSSSWGTYIIHSASFPFNTDGFGIFAKNVKVTNLVAFNGDDGMYHYFLHSSDVNIVKTTSDGNHYTTNSVTNFPPAIAISDGASDVTVTDSTVGYQTHGLSIGSLGKTQSKVVGIKNILFDRITFAGGLYGARLKSWVGGQGLVENVAWTNIHMHNVTFPIFITQTYEDQNAAGGDRPNNSSVILKDFTFANITGDINSYDPGDLSCRSEPCWYDVGLPNLQQTESIIIECNTKESCSGFKTSNINLYPQKESASPSVICINAESDLNPGLGFECANGTYVPL